MLFVRIIFVLENVCLNGKASTARRRALERHNPERIGRQLLDAYADMSKEFEKKKS